MNTVRRIAVLLDEARRLAETLPGDRSMQRSDLIAALAESVRAAHDLLVAVLAHR